MCHKMCTLQAEPEIVSTQTTTFADAVSGVTVGQGALTTDLDTGDAAVSAGLTDFLARPVRIANFTWLESDPIGILQTISPWRLFFDNPAIKYKLNNFAFARCNLKIKVVVNASPFYYGAMRLCYQPLPSFTPSTIINDAGTRYFIPYSQQPGLWVKPENSEGGEMTLPFFCPRNFLRIQRASDTDDMGLLRFINYAALQSANGVTGQGVTVQVYAWAEDVVLGGPSVGLSMQALDEYGSGPVSGPASTVARYAGMAKGIPVIGKFATATEMGAKAISGIAKLFGFTNVPVIEPTQPIRPSPFPQMASCELGYPVEKLTVDSKNELTIDPSSIGLPAHDDLAIESLVTRQSYLCAATWTTTTPVDTPLFTSRVTPHMFDVTVDPQPKVYRTPMSLVSQLFRNWRGDVIFTFKFVASKYHKGRVRISYDPVNASVQTAGDTGSTVFNAIVDLGVENEVEFRVPYQQALAWMSNNTALTIAEKAFTVSATPTLTLPDDFTNGMISMKVLTLLTAPVGTSTVPILVFVRAADNMEFANPRGVPQETTQWAIQAMAEEVIGADMSIGKTHSDKIIERNRVNFGEDIRSVRQLLRRSNFIDTITPASDTNALGYWYYHMTRFPQFYGYDPNGMYQAKGLVATTTNFQFNYTQNTPWHLIAPCFVAHKGSAHWHFNVEAPTPVSSIYFARNAESAATGTGQANVSQAYGTPNSNVNFFRQNTTRSAGGMALTNQNTNAGLSVSVPNYTNYKFQSTYMGNFTKPPAVGSGDDGSRFETSYLVANFNGAATPTPQNFRISRYFGVGTDYNLFFFLNVPTVYLMTGTIVPT